MLEFTAVLCNKDNYMGMEFVDINEFDKHGKYSTDYFTDTRLTNEYNAYLNAYKEEYERVAGCTQSVRLHLPVSEREIDEALAQLGINRFDKSLDNLEVEYYCSFNVYSPPDMQGLEELNFINSTAEFYTSLDIEDDIILEILNYFGKECSKGKYIQLYYED